MSVHQARLASSTEQANVSRAEQQALDTLQAAEGLLHDELNCGPLVSVVIPTYN